MEYTGEIHYFSKVGKWLLITEAKDGTPCEMFLRCTEKHWAQL